MPRIKKAGTNSKKKTLLSSQAVTDRVQKLRGEYWEKVKNIAPENLVFLDEMGVLLGLTRNYARSPHGTRVSDLKPFYWGAKITAIGAISIKKVLALMTINDSMDGKAFEVFTLKVVSPGTLGGSGSSNG